MNFICGIDDTRPEFPDLDLEAPCCIGSAMRGGHACTCWKPVFDAPGQADPVDGMEPMLRPGGMCGDCAYRPDSPEQRGDPQHHSNSVELEQQARDGRRFFCHTNMRRIVRWEHPSGEVLPGHPAEYAPPVNGDVPIQVNGVPAYVCAGWDARRRALAAKGNRR